MTFTLILIVTTQASALALPIGTFSSLAVCEVEKAALVKQLTTPMPAPAGPPFGYHVSCARKT